jgi:hypothetical protein
MIFAIQASRPAVLIPTEQEVADLAAAIQVIFPMNTEDAILTWNHIPVRIGYKYDLSVLIDDLLPLLLDVITLEEGHREISGGSDTFSVEWSIDWKKDHLSVLAKWHSVAGGYADLLNSRNKIEITRDQFLREWKSILRTLIDSFDEVKISIMDMANLEILRDIEKRITGWGELYSG